MENEIGIQHATNKAGIYMVSVCDFVCILSDLRVIFVQQKFEREIKSLSKYMYMYIKICEVYVKITDTDKENPYVN